MANNFFSIEFDERYIKIIDIRKKGDLFELKYIGKIDLLNDFFSSDLEKTIETQANLLKNFLENLNINIKNVVISIPNYYTYHQILEMPMLKEKELLSAIKYQADQFIPTSLNETNIDIEVINEDIQNKKLLILVAAAPKKIIEKVQSTIELTGLIPMAIETQISSTARFFVYFLENQSFDNYDDNDLILIHFDYQSTTLMNFKSKSKILTKIHNVPIGFNLFFKEISINTNLDKEKISDFFKNYQPDKNSALSLDQILKPLVNELTFEINRFISNSNPKNIFFINEIINFPYLLNLLNKGFQNITFEIINPQQFFLKNSLLDTVTYELPLYFSIIGTDLR